MSNHSFSFSRPCNHVYIQENPHHPHILVVTGSSGSGKSTAVELFCRERGVGVEHWTDACWETALSSSSRYFAPSSSAARRRPNSVAAEIIISSSLRAGASGADSELRHGLVDSLFKLDDRDAGYLHDSAISSSSGGSKVCLCPVEACWNLLNFLD